MTGVEEIIPYVVKVTQPGVRVVFLVPNPVDRLTIDYRGDLRSHSTAAEIHNCKINRRISMEAERRTRFGEGLPSMHPWENRRCGREERSFPVCEYPWEN